MSGKALVILICLITTLLFFGKHIADRKINTSAGKTAVFFNFKLETVKEIEISAKNKKIILKAADGGKWIAPASSDYEASLSKISALLLKLLNLSSSQVITSNKENYKRLGLSDEEKTSIIIFDESHNEIAGLDIGKIMEARGSNYYGDKGKFAKSHSSDTVYLISEDLNISSEANDWLENLIIDLPAKDIEEIKYLKTEPPLNFVKKKGDAENFEIRGINKGDREKSYAVTQAAGAYANLTFINVLPENDGQAGRLKFEEMTEAVTKEGIHYKFSCADDSGKFFLKITAVKPEAKSEAKPEEMQVLYNKTEELNQKYSKWIYQLESWNASNFTRKYSDFTEQEEDKTPKMESKTVKGTMGASVGTMIKPPLNQSENKTGEPSLGQESKPAEPEL